MTEFELIRRYFEPLASTADGADGVVLGQGDDAAVLRVASGRDLVVATDTCVAGRHFPDDLAPGDIGYRALAVNVSDLAAMGAVPRWFQLAVTLPRADEDWLAGFAAGLGEAAREHGVALTGGDTTSGPLSVTVTILGEVSPGQALLRSGAGAGDRVLVSGSLGDAAAGLAVLTGALADAPPASGRWLAERFRRPRARSRLGVALGGLASAAIDISDGLIQDLGHIADASGVAIRIDAERVPLSPALLASVPDREARRAFALSGGDDYELAFCVPEETVTEVGSRAAALAVDVTEIGVVARGTGVVARDAAGEALAVERTGFRHFG